MHTLSCPGVVLGKNPYPIEKHALPSPPLESNEVLAESSTSFCVQFFQQLDDRVRPNGVRGDSQRVVFLDSLTSVSIGVGRRRWVVHPGYPKVGFDAGKKVMKLSL